ncbi:hypothetical protein [Patulibacter medicamentivorans]|uniref:hypothetical protein n=1 Tax=Patulibacter medicamentivorans TaxID=1097667 RepID=UPI00068295BF|nr:hypothetical protein [Patulibacter medicamentivorans]
MQTQRKNPWVALEASADPVDLARRLQAAHSAVIAHDARVPADVRPVVLESWRRTAGAGVDPDDHDPPVVLDEHRIDDARREHPLAITLPAVRQAVGRVAQDAGHLLVVTDASGTLLWAEGHSAVKDAAWHLGFFEGARWAEADVGTNAIGTALAIDHPVQIFSGEHFVRTHHPWVCSGAPIHDPETGAALGVIDLSGPLRTAHPMILGFVTSAARMAEHLLAERMHQRDRVLHEALLEDLEHRTHGRCAVVSRTGRVVASWPHGWLSGRIDLTSPGSRVTLPDGTVGQLEPVGAGVGFLVRSTAAGCPTPGGMLLAEARVAAIAEPAPAGSPVAGPAPAASAPAPAGTAVVARGAGPGHPPPAVRDHHPEDATVVTLLTDGTPHVRWPGGGTEVGLRHAEILCLLALHPGGLSGEQLALRLYGEAGNPVTVRAEISRLRRLLGERLQTRPYRLAEPFDVDVVGVREALRDGRLTEAMLRYAVPLLPRSQAPGVVELRDELEGALQCAARGSNDAATLLAWIETTEGHEDLPAHQRLSAVLADDDPRAPLVHARTARLEQRLAGRDPYAEPARGR